MAEDRLLEMGQVGRAHGIKGELSLIWHGEAWPGTSQTLVLEDSAGKRSDFLVRSVRSHKGGPLVFLKDIPDRNAAEALLGQKIFMRANELEPPKDDESWLADLVGMDVELENGEKLGRLDHVEFPANQEIWAIVNDDGREILFPAQPHFLVGLDTEKGLVTIRPPEGLLDIYNA